MKALDAEQYRAMIEHAPVMVWRAGVDAKCDYFNSTWLAFTGRNLEQELGDGWAESVHPDDLDRCLAFYLGHFEQRRTFEMEYRLRRHDGVYRTIFDRGAPYSNSDGSFGGFIGTCIEVDDRRTQDAAFGAVEFFEMSLDNLCVAGFDGYWKRLNGSWTRTLGWTPEELMSKPSIEFVHPADRAATLEAREGLKAGKPALALVNRYLCKDGSHRWFEWRSVSHVSRGLVYAVARDITEQREAQHALRELTESLTTTLNSIADGVIAASADGTVARMNPVAQSLTGWTFADAQGKRLDEVFHIVHADTRLRAALPVERTLREGIAENISDRTLLVGRDGTARPIASSCAPMRNAEGGVSGAVLVFRDMTAENDAKAIQEQMQRQLILVDRLASVGTLAAGVAHEINNPLASVMANLDILAEELGRTSGGLPSAQAADWTEMIRDARQGMERIRKVVRGLKTFSRSEEERRAVIDVRPVLELSIDMALNEIRHRARLVKDYGEVPLVEADDARLGQVFINLLVNAAQALGEGDAEANEIRVVTATDAMGRAVIEVRDTGPGIPADVIERVFDPFFTTKPVGVGTGLGLSICHNIVTSMGGQITVRNRERRGATFRIVLPAVSDRLDGARDDAYPTERAPTVRRAVVLVVDDERAVGVALGRVLRDHDVTVVTSAQEALDIVLRHDDFDVILSDLMMPTMSGMDLYDELSRRRPKAAERMVFITGGAFTRAAKAFLDRVPNERLDKPFDPARVRSLVQEFIE